MAVFGKKDYQQLMVLRQMVRQFALPIDVVGSERERADDGLALSSRNGYLSADERAEAVQLSSGTAAPWRTQALQGSGPAAGGSAGPGGGACAQARLGARLPGRCARRADLQLPGPTDGAGTLVALGAARLGSTRLIDNLEV